MKYGAFSEIGKLRKILVCRPGLAHKRLTPGNCQDLLFDDVIWVAEGQSQHRDFVAKMFAEATGKHRDHGMPQDRVALSGGGR